MPPSKPRMLDDEILRRVRVEIAKLGPTRKIMVLARLTGVHHNWLRRVSTGEIDDPGHKMLMHVAQYLGVKVRMARGRHFTKYET